MAVAVARGTEILWEEGFGWTDRPGGTAATADTLYYAASVTKAITATALMVLRERGQLDLDRPANVYLHTARLRSPHWNPDEATVRHLANHTAGLTTYDGWEQIPAAETIRRYGIVFWRPGERFDYSNDDRYGYRTLLAQGGTCDSNAWLLVPSEHIAVVVLANSGNVLAMRVIDQVLSRLLPPYRETVVPQATAQNRPVDVS